MLIIGIFPGTPAAGIGHLAREPFMPAGVKGVAGSMLIVIFAYAGFEIIGLAASETANPGETVPKAIRNTVIGLVGIYILTTLVLLPIVPTAELSESKSPMVAALSRAGIEWASSVMNIVLITAILSASLASMFGIGRMMRSLADEGDAPKWLEDKTDVPYRGMLFSGFFELIALWFALIGMIIVILSMPFIAGQGSGLVAGIIMVAAYLLFYRVMKLFRTTKEKKYSNEKVDVKLYRNRLAVEFSGELADGNKAKDKDA